MYYVKVLDGLLFVSHWKGNFSFNGVFSGASPPKLSFHIQSVKVVDLNGRGGGGEPIRSIFTLEWKLREDPTLQIISHSPPRSEISFKAFISSRLNFPQIWECQRRPQRYLFWQRNCDATSGILTENIYLENMERVGIVLIVFWQSHKISVWRIWNGLVLCSLWVISKYVLLTFRI